MKKGFLGICAVTLVVALSRQVPPTPAAENPPGEQAFQKHCAVCHPNGKNIVNPAFTLDKKNLEKHDILKPADIVGKLRNPGPGMPKFDKETVPDRTANAIAEYILKKFR